MLVDWRNVEVVCNTKGQKVVLKEDPLDPFNKCPVCDKAKRGLFHPFGCSFVVTTIRGPSGGGGAGISG